MRREELSVLLDYFLWVIAVPSMWILGYVLALATFADLSPLVERFPLITVVYAPALCANLIQGLALRRLNVSTLHWLIVTTLGYAIAIFIGAPGLSILPATAQSLLLRKQAARWPIWGLGLVVAVESQFLWVLIFTFLFGGIDPAVSLMAAGYFTVITGLGAYLSKIGAKPS